MDSPGNRVDDVSSPDALNTWTVPPIATTQPMTAAQMPTAGGNVTTEATMPTWATAIDTTASTLSTTAVPELAKEHTTISLESLMTSVVWFTIALFLRVVAGGSRSRRSSVSSPVDSPPEPVMV